MTSTLNPADYIITYYNTNASNEPYDGSPTVLFQTLISMTYSITGTNATIWVRFEEISTDVYWWKTFNLNVVPTPTGTISFSASPYCNNIATPQAITETSLTPGGVYSATPAGLIIDPATGAITPFGSTVGIYTSLIMTLGQRWAVHHLMHLRPLRLKIVHVLWMYLHLLRHPVWIHLWLQLPMVQPLE